MRMSSAMEGTNCPDEVEPTQEGVLIQILTALPEPAPAYLLGRAQAATTSSPICFGEDDKQLNRKMYCKC